MKDPRNDKDGALEASVNLYRTGRIKRRDFIRMAVSASVTAGLAGALCLHKAGALNRGEHVAGLFTGVQR